MNLEYKNLFDPNFHPSSRVWIYQSSRLFTMSEALEIEGILHGFQNQWQSHGADVKNELHLIFGQFIVFIADETSTTVGGCSTDSSVRLVKEIEKKFAVNLFDRQTLAFHINDKIELLPMAQIPYALEKGFLKPETLYFNNMVATKKELEEKWMIPVAESWLASRFSEITSV